MPKGGGEISKHYKSLDSILKDYGSEKSQKELNGFLSAVLRYATDNVEFYKPFRNFSSLSAFPVINKVTVRDHESMFLSPHYEKSKLFIQETSGSTGMPFAVFQDPVKRARATADTLWFSHLAKYELGQRLYFSRVWDKKTKRSRLTCLKQNWVVHDSGNLSEEKVEAFISALEKDRSKKSVILFASTLTAITKYLAAHGRKTTADVESFITLSEALDPVTKQMAQQQFGTAVVSRYSNQELGIMAQQEIGSDDFLLNVGSFYFEFLDLDSDTPVEPGKPGRIVVTDLFNFSMPLIRYDTGDIAVQKPTKPGELPRLLTVEGRRVDFIYATDGSLVSPYVINTPMHEYQDISQYQFIQESEKGYVMLLTLRPGVKCFVRENDMLLMLKSYLGKDASIEVRYVDEISVLKSGKRKQVVNNYKR